MFVSSRLRGSHLILATVFPQVSAAVEFVKLTHPHPKVPEYVTIYSRALHAVLGGASVRQQAEYALRKLEAWDACQSYSRKAARSV